MRTKSIFIILFSLFFLSGCSIKGGPGGLLGYSSTISTEEVNDAMAKAFPLRKKSSFGTILLKKASLKPMEEGDRIALSLGFAMTSFEIPEGIDGAMTLSAGLRYDPKTKKIFLKEVTPLATSFFNGSLSKYVSKGAKSALGVIAMKELSDIEIYQVKESFTARFIKTITVSKGNIVIRYGL